MSYIKLYRAKERTSLKRYAVKPLKVIPLLLVTRGSVSLVDIPNSTLRGGSRLGFVDCASNNLNLSYLAFNVSTEFVAVS